MPAVDWRLDGGLSDTEVVSLARPLVQRGLITGMDVTIYNPSLDSDDLAAGRRDHDEMTGSGCRSFPLAGAGRSPKMVRRSVCQRPGPSGGRREGCGMELQFPECRKCEDGVLLPLSDYGRDGAPITYKAWVCSNPACGFNLRIDNGEISFGRAIGQSAK